MPSGPVPAQPRRASTGRRTVLAAGAAALLAGGLAGCGIRLEDDAPHVPLIPTRTPVPGEAAVLALLADGRTALALCRRWPAGGPLGAALAVAHEAQNDVLAALLRRGGVPAETVARAGSPDGPGATATPSATSGGGAAAPVTASDLGAVEGRPLTDLTALAATVDPLRPVVASVLAQRLAAVEALTHRWTDPAPAGTPPTGPPGSVSAPAGTSPPTGATATTSTATTWPPEAAADLVAATRSAAYGFQVVTARSTGAVRARGLATLATLAVLESRQLARCPRPPAPPAGYDLPFPVDGPAAVARLGAALGGGLRTAYGALLDPTRSGASAEAFVDLVGWLGRAEVLAVQWGAPHAPFPGLTR